MALVVLNWTTLHTVYRSGRNAPVNNWLRLRDRYERALMRFRRWNLALRFGRRSASARPAPVG
jgi:hypothetical protein